MGKEIRKRLKVKRMQRERGEKREQREGEGSEDGGGVSDSRRFLKGIEWRKKEEENYERQKG